MVVDMGIKIPGIHFQYQNRKITGTEKDGQSNTCDGSSGRPSALLKISYFTVNLQYMIFYIIILGLGKKTKIQDRFLAIQ
jgi:hypothetical protein